MLDDCMRTVSVVLELVRCKPPEARGQDADRVVANPHAIIDGGSVTNRLNMPDRNLVLSPAKVALAAAWAAGQISPNEVNTLKPHNP